MGHISGATKIAGKFTVDDWKSLRLKLLGSDYDNVITWKEAYNIFRERINTRFIEPINKILSGGKLRGEGFAVAALQAILIEFLEAFYQGKIYRTPLNEDGIERRASRLGIPKDELRNHVQPNEYNSSSRLFRDFLTSHQPFQSEFTNATASAYYENIRCGLLHEAATKGGTTVKGKIRGSLIQTLPGGDFILHRTDFQIAIRKRINAYENELLSSDKLKLGFIRKMDDICQIKYVYYFAYGSNMNSSQMGNRVGFIYNKYVGFIKNYAFCYNKKSKDTTSKANIIPLENDITYGVCFEIEKEDFKKLIEIEKGYKPISVPFYTLEGTMIISKTFISDVFSEAFPSPEYVELIINGARENQINEEYIQQKLKK